MSPDWTGSNSVRQDQHIEPKFGSNAQNQNKSDSNFQTFQFKFQASDSSCQTFGFRIQDFRLQHQQGASIMAGMVPCFVIRFHKNMILKRQEWNHVDYALELSDFRFQTLKQLSDSIFQTSHLQLQIPGSTLQNPACRFEVQDSRFQGSVPRFQF